MKISLLLSSFFLTHYLILYLLAVIEAGVYGGEAEAAEGLGRLGGGGEAAEEEEVCWGVEG